jgi:hypothetical protein
VEFPKSKIKAFFDVVLKGESKTYNDHNWYTSGGLKGYIEGQSKTPYSKLSKPLSQYTIGDVRSFQSRSRDNVGQLWATGRYQIIPDTLKGLISKAGLDESQPYNQENQDKLAMQLLINRSSIRKYLKGEVPDTQQNLEAAALSMAQIWSSVGVPYAMQGSKKRIQKNESYYSGGGDKATVKTEDVQKALRELKNSYGKSEDSDEKKNDKKFSVGAAVLALLTTVSIYFLVTNYKSLKK